MTEILTSQYAENDPSMVIHTIPIYKGLSIKTSWEHISEGLGSEASKRGTDGWANVFEVDGEVTHVLLDDGTISPIHNHSGPDGYNTQAEAVAVAIQECEEEGGGNVTVSPEEDGFEADDGDVRVWYHLDEKLVSDVRKLSGEDELGDFLTTYVDEFNPFNR